MAIGAFFRKVNPFTDEPHSSGIPFKVEMKNIRRIAKETADYQTFTRTESNARIVLDRAFSLLSHGGEIFFTADRKIIVRPNSKDGQSLRQPSRVSSLESDES